MTVGDLLAANLSDYPATFNGGEEVEGSYEFSGDLLEYESTDVNMPGFSCIVTVTFVPAKANAFAAVTGTVQINVINEFSA
jgi:hypothetical protein